MKILFIAPMPPPVAGHSLAAQVLHDELQKYHEVEVVNFNKSSFVEGISSFKRIIEVLFVLLDVLRKIRGTEVIYFTISESFAGNLKDLFIYCICYSKLSKMYIHLHGGSIKRLLWDNHPFIHKINKFFIRKMRGVIISGKSHFEVFDDIVENDKIKISSNFALDYLFLPENNIRKKFEDLQCIRILYMSNMIDKKGYLELCDAYLELAESFKSKLKLDFVGRFELESQQEAFLNKIEGCDHVKYHGVVDDDAKQKLFQNAHVFCLPTSFFEGQPISILEAYASGCVVITTGQSGILDIFKDKENGYMLKEGKSKFIKTALENLINENDQLLSIALFNKKLSDEKYTTRIYHDTLRKIIES
jgi:glycosyltransferase involved in cell wall biosynthesis